MGLMPSRNRIIDRANFARRHLSQIIGLVCGLANIENNSNEQKAAEAAGYSGHGAYVQCSRLLNNARVRAAYAIAAELDGLKNGIPLPFKRQVLWDTAQKCRTEEHWNPQGVARCIEILSKMDGDMQPDGGGQVTIQISTGLAGKGVTVDGEVVTQPAGLVESDA